MRVTQYMRDHVKSLLMKKVQSRYDAAGAAWKAAEKERHDLLDEVRRYASGLAERSSAQVAAFAARRGLTWILEERDWKGRVEGPNLAFGVDVGADDFRETASSPRCRDEAKWKARQEIEGEPKRILDAVQKAADAVCFALELGKVGKAELEGLIEETEVEL